MRAHQTAAVEEGRPSLVLVVSVWRNGESVRSRVVYEDGDGVRHEHVSGSVHGLLETIGTIADTWSR